MLYKTPASAEQFHPSDCNGHTFHFQPGDEGRQRYAQCQLFPPSQKSLIDIILAAANSLGVTSKSHLSTKKPQLQSRPVWIDIQKGVFILGKMQKKCDYCKILLILQFKHFLKIRTPAILGFQYFLKLNFEHFCVFPESPPVLWTLSQIFQFCLLTPP